MYHFKNCSTYSLNQIGEKSAKHNNYQYIIDIDINKHRNEFCMALCIVKYLW